MSKPLAVLISDVHYSLPTLELADVVTRMAIACAEKLDIPLIIAGDFHDTKANLRGECVNAMIDAISSHRGTTYILRGNHDSINEKSFKSACNFLGNISGVKMIDDCGRMEDTGIYLFAYHHDLPLLRTRLGLLPNGATVIMHQGLKHAKSGEYGDFDKTALSPEDVSGLRVISGHYHARQTILLPDSGVWDFIGNPYTLTFGEAGDPPKGFQILNDDGSLEFVPTNLRKHVVFSLRAREVGRGTVLVYDTKDLLWLKISGTSEELSKLTRENAIHIMDLRAEQIKIDFIALNSTNEEVSSIEHSLPLFEQLDGLIDASNVSAEQKLRIKALWRSNANS